ncbi:polyprenyl synthetase family protein [Streptomyces sp. NPDC048309]|uniref:polyprenyl synthetase family protein n=1 Tax=unclassified Streptomyces TaxID=2593676 RepID=UPI00340EC80D
MTTSTAVDALASQRSSIDQVLHTFLSTPHFTEPELIHATSLLHDFVLDGGKRLRPSMCCVGYSAITGQDPPAAVLRAAASLELFHAFALIHDDVMDCSDTRRGNPTLHRSLSRKASDLSGPADHDGISKAILVGDLALVWSDQILHTSGLSPQQLHDARPVVDAMRTEVMGGQYLDVAAAGSENGDINAALRIIRYKTAKYTIERPLHLGAVLGGATAQHLQTFTDYAMPLGEAFQLRDDLLGVFGDPMVTGKSRLDDLREGKNTVLMGVALRDTTPSQRQRLQQLWGKNDLTEGEAEQVRDILTVCGARRTVEEMVETRHQQVLARLESSSLAPQATTRLRQLADAVTRRTL